MRPAILRTWYSPLVQLFVGLLLAAALCKLLGVFPASVAAQQNPPLKISSPANGTVVAEGTTLTVSVVSPNGTSFSQLALVGPDPIGFNVLRQSAPAQFSIAIPADADCHLYKIYANGVTTSGQGVTSAPIQIDIERSDFPLSLVSTTNTRLTLESIGAQSPLALFAVFGDAKTVDLTRSTLLAYSSSNTAVATVNAGVVTATGPGHATITATYPSGGNNLPVSIPVTVRILTLDR